MNVLIRTFIIAYLFCFSANTLIVKAQNSVLTEIDSTETEYLLQVGEELTYIVRYAFFNLGEIKFKVQQSNNVHERDVVETIAYMDSYKGLPFVDLHHIYYSYIDSTFYPAEFFGLMLEKDTNFVKYVFESDSLIKVTKGDFNSGKITFDSITTVDQKYQDGLSIMFFARKFAGSDTTQKIPCFVNEKTEKTIINYYPENVSVEIEKLDYPVDCLKIDGETDFVSVYGLTGHFEGWFSNDAHAVPILAKMNVLIGSVTLELIDWKKEDWNPPEYLN